jgi:D-alanine-D-alanine ligase
MGDLSRCRVLVAHNPVVLDEDDPATADVLSQVCVVEEALALAGVPCERAVVTGGRPWESPAIAAAARQAVPSFGGSLRGLRAISDNHRDIHRPDAATTVVFNLVEAPPGVPEVQSGNAAALELMGIPFTGSGSSMICLTTDKLVTRAVLAAAGLPVAPGGRLDDGAEVLSRVPPPWIVKPAWEDASVGLEGNPVCATREAALARAATLAERFPGEPVLVERFLAGRELNVSLLSRATDADGPAGVEVLPVAEIAFVDFPPDVPPFVGFEAKWHTSSFAYTHTLRRFPDESEDGPLLARARELALAAWQACGGGEGYGRIDLRADEEGRLHVLEVNANPCIDADAGFMAAAERGGLTRRDVIERIVAAAVK